MKRIFTICKNYGIIPPQIKTKLELAAKYKVNKETTKRDFKELKGLKIIEKIGSDKTGSWQIVKQ